MGSTTPLMSAFVSELVGSVTTAAKTFILAAVGSYWGVILSVLFVGFMIGLFWYMARKVFGHKQF